MYDYVLTGTILFYCVRIKIVEKNLHNYNIKSYTPAIA